MNARFLSKQTMKKGIPTASWYLFFFGLAFYLAGCTTSKLDQGLFWEFSGKEIQLLEYMNEIKKRLLLGGFLTLTLLQALHAQTLQFTAVRATDEKAIQLRWQSQSNAVYSIEYTPELSGEIVWDTLVDVFASQGTNTVFLDTGKYWTEPALAHPKDDPQRFYRVVKTGTNSLVPPIVTITNLSAGTNVSGEVEIGVHVTTTNNIIFVHYFVDGEEVELGSVDDNGNSSYTINTTEWPNGSHEIFVVAETASGYTTTGIPATEQTGAGTSAIIPVTFDNWISRWYFSLPGFDASLGETQRITAKFEGYSCWTLEIVDEFNTTVRNASGSGTTMLFDWDGKDDNGFDTADGTYDFILSADACSPLMGESESSASKSASLSEPPSPIWLAMPANGSGSVVPLAIYPPGLDTSHLTIFEGVLADYLPKASCLEGASSSGFSESLGEGAGPMAATAPQSTRRPRRPPPKPIKGTPGRIGIAWQGHHPDTTTGIPGFNPPANLVGNIQLDPNYALPYGGIKNATNIAKGFERAMTKYKWKTAFNYGNDKLTAALLRKPSKGGSNLFNYCNIGLLIGHGIRGNNQDFRATPTPSLQTYMPIYRTGVNAYDWVRMSEFDFGGGPVGLRWMGIFACNMLSFANAQDMYNKGVLPLNENGSIILAEETSIFMYPEFGRLWASFMNGGEDGVKHTIIDSWNLASRKAHLAPGAIPSGYSLPVIMTSAYWPDCVNDKLLSYTANSSNDPSEILFRRQRVFPDYTTLP